MSIFRSCSPISVIFIWSFWFSQVNNPQNNNKYKFSKEIFVTLFDLKSLKKYFLKSVMREIQNNGCQNSLPWSMQVFVELYFDVKTIKCCKCLFGVTNPSLPPSNCYPFYLTNSMAYSLLCCSHNTIYICIKIGADTIRMRVFAVLIHF